MAFTPLFLLFCELLFDFVESSTAFFIKMMYLCTQKHFLDNYGKESIIDDSRWMGNRKTW